MTTSSLTSKGQVTIPKQVRDHLGLSAGDRVEFVVEEDGSVTVKPVSRSVLSLFGVLRHRGRAVSVEEMNRSIAEGRARDDARIRRGRAR
jgi:antitoxin PrlF